MTAAPVVRPVEPADFGAIAQLTNHYIRTSAVHFAYEDVTAAELLAGFREHERRYPFLLVTCGGQFAGYAKASAWRARAAYGWTAETGLYVVPEQHGRGVGTLLYRRLMDLLRMQGFRTAIGGITLPNQGSIALHERLGFQPAGVVRRAGFKHGRWHDVAFWQLDLRPDDAEARAVLTPQEAWARMHGAPGR